MRENSKTPLVVVVTACTMIVTAAAMAIYAAVQYSAGDHSRSILGLFLEHGWHVLGLGLLTFSVLYLFLLKKVVKPIRSLYLKLYAVSRGDLRPVSVDSNILEIQQIAEGINLMLAKIDMNYPDISLKGMSLAAGELRDLAKNAPSMSDNTRENLLRIAQTIDRATTVLTAGAVKEEAASTTTETAGLAAAAGS